MDDKGMAIPSNTDILKTWEVSSSRVKESHLLSSAVVLALAVAGWFIHVCKISWKEFTKVAFKNVLPMKKNRACQEECVQSCCIHCMLTWLHFLSGHGRAGGCWPGKSHWNLQLQP